MNMYSGLQYATSLLQFKRHFKIVIGIENNNNVYHPVVQILKRNHEINLTIAQWHQLQHKFGDIIAYFGRLKKGEKKEEEDVTLMDDNNISIHLTHGKRRYVVFKKNKSSMLYKEIYFNKKQIVTIIHNAWLINNFLHKLLLLITLENDAIISENSALVGASDNCVDVSQFECDNTLQQ